MPSEQRGTQTKTHTIRDKYYQKEILSQVEFAAAGSPLLPGRQRDSATYPSRSAAQRTEAAAGSRKAPGSTYPSKASFTGLGVSFFLLQSFLPPVVDAEGSSTEYSFQRRRRRRRRRRVYARSWEIYSTRSILNSNTFQFFGIKFDHSSYSKICVKYHFFRRGLVY